MSVNFEEKIPSVDSTLPNKEGNRQVDLPSILEDRLAAVAKQAFTGMREMNIPDEVSSRVMVLLNTNEISPNPNVNKRNGNIILEIPLLFLVRTGDHKKSAELMTWIMGRFQNCKFTEKDVANLQAFNQFIKDPINSEKAKKFVLYHELAHILHDDFAKVNNAESRAREKRADLTSADFSGEASGGIYLFNIVSPYFDKGKSTTHPLFKERIEYLKAYMENQEDQKLETSFSQLNIKDQ